ncbi:restriction endonuclease [Fusobacterium nucleatum]|uniref:Restriction endonuclease n=1 Tax=Fusobacterium nucleatum TaxID=851 RepID=A0A2N6TJI5_FUSNU|nr:McrC family protein [Fusobacterium nucleatum]PMC69472.1 restriction endonuclease [Fusobacterium nucleatum]
MNKFIQLKELQDIISKKDYEDEENIYLPEKDFKELISFIEEFVGSEEETDVMDFMKVYKTKDRNLGTVVKVNNYVGLIQLKSGYKIEILPKIDFIDDKDKNKTKEIFLKMLRSLKDFLGKNFKNADLKISKMNLYEIFINMYLSDVRVLVKNGLKSTYVVKEDNIKFYKGKLQVSQHIKMNLVHKERFYMVYDEFLVDRAENKLVKATLLKLQKLTSSSQNSKEIRQLLIAFELVETSTNYEKDFSKVSIDKNTKDYANLMKWSKVFLLNKSFTSFSGKVSSRAILFPMEKVFESYIAQQVRKKFLPDNWEVSIQDNGYHLFVEKNASNSRPIFSLKPDIVLKKENKIVILDTKWKRLISESRKNYGISSADMYQMYAYAKKYEENGIIPEVYVIYPKTDVMKESKYFESNDGVKVNIFFIDLVNIEKSLEELNNMIK